MFYTTLDNVSQHRTIKPLYAFHQATPQGFTLDPNWDTSTADILPGMVMTNIGGNCVTLSDGLAGTASYGLSAAFCAPVLKIDEVTDSGIDAMGVWVGGLDAQFSVLAPAFDTGITGTNSVSWSDAAEALEDGTEVLLVPGKGTANRGKLVPQVATSNTDAGHATDKDASPIARLIEVVSTTEIIISLGIH